MITCHTNLFSKYLQYHIQEGYFFGVKPRFTHNLKLKKIFLISRLNIFAMLGILPVKRDLSKQAVGNRSSQCQLHLFNNPQFYLAITLEPMVQLNNLLDLEYASGWNIT